MISFFKRAHERIHIYAANMSWILVEKILHMGVGFGISVILARHLGPDQFGVLAYALSLVTLFGSAGHVGLNGLVVREVVKQPDEYKEILGTSAVLKLAGYLLGFCAAVTFAFFTEKTGATNFLVILVAASALFVKPLDVIDYWFQSRLQAKYTAISQGSAQLVWAICNIVLVYLSATVLFFAFSFLLQNVIAALVLCACFYTTTRLKPGDLSFSKNRAKNLFNDGVIIFIGSIFAVVYLKIDQLMLKWMWGSQEVGVYAVAATLSEAWYFFPVAVAASVFPRLIELKAIDEAKYRQRLQQLFDLLFLAALLVAVLFSYIADFAIPWLFGKEYSGASGILIVHIWASIFIFMRAVFSRWILIENMLIFSLITQGAGAVCNVGLNLVLIPDYGGLGAAYATLISYASASYFALLLNKKTRPVFWQMSKAIFSPIRYPYHFVSKHGAAFGR